MFIFYVRFGPKKLFSVPFSNNYKAPWLEIRYEKSSNVEISKSFCLNSERYLVSGGG